MNRIPARVWGWLVVAALTTGIVVFAVLAFGRWEDRDQPVSLSEAPAADAEAAATDFFTIDYRTLEEDMDRVLSSATGEFESQYLEQSKQLRASVGDKHLVLTASVPESGAALEYLAADEAWYLVSVDVHTEGQGGLSQDGRYRTRVVLERSDDEWLVARLEQVG